MNTASSNPRGDSRGPQAIYTDHLAYTMLAVVPGAIPGGPRAICTALPVKSPDVFFWNRSSLSLSLVFVDYLR